MKIVELIINQFRKPKKKQTLNYNCWTIRLPIDMQFPNDSSFQDKSTALKKLTEENHQ